MEDVYDCRVHIQSIATIECIINNPLLQKLSIPENWLYEVNIK